MVLDVWVPHLITWNPIHAMETCLRIFRMHNIHKIHDTKERAQMILETNGLNLNSWETIRLSFAQ